MNAEPQKQHQWLDRFIGEWTWESDCSMGADKPPMKTIGTEVVRSLGGLWIIAEGEGGQDASSGRTIITLGYDPQSDRFVGTFIASMMTHLWIYNGSLDAAEKVLTLDAEGPSLTESGISKYQDIIEFVNDDYRVLKSQILEDNDKWNHFMTAHYRRQK
jgi:Protein of unknown function (DUF1579)